jgi:CMP/dCMP kinase
MPIVTISRMYGAGGSEIAARVAAALGWALVDNALVDAVAARLGVSRGEVAAREERLPSLAQRVADAMALATPELLVPRDAEGAQGITEERLLEVTRAAIREAASKGPAVIVGRGSQAALAERADALHVLCCAPRPALVAAVMRRDGVPESVAAARVDQTNHQREQYVRRHWKREWLAPQNYHVCVNTTLLGMDGAADLVTRLARERFADSAG